VTFSLAAVEREILRMLLEARPETPVLLRLEIWHSSIAHPPTSASNRIFDAATMAKPMKSPFATLKPVRQPPPSDGKTGWPVDSLGK
jgi:hypothetical protein